MRLTCPNCAAQYEIDGSMVPPPGRDVQCSNCGHTWFQLAETDGGAPDAVATEPAPAADEAGTAPGSAAVHEGEAASGAVAAEAAGSFGAEGGAGRPRHATRDEDEAEPLWPEVGPGDEPAGLPAADAATAAGTMGAPVRRPPLDDAVMDLLRQEAEREAAARRAEAQAALQSQPDLGLSPPSARHGQTVERSADLAGMDPAEAAAAEAAAALAARPRRETLPDVEEINSSLAGRGSAADRSDVPAPAGGEERRRGFRTGFLAMILLAALAIVAYVQADRLAAAWPAAAPAIGAFTRTVDAGRLWLDRAARSASETIRGLAASGDAPP